MIKLAIEPYCSECEDFDPIVHNFSRYVLDTTDNTRRYNSKRIVICVHHKRCKMIEQCIKENRHAQET